MALPAGAYPAELTVWRTVTDQALVHFWGNRYSVPPGLIGGHVQLRWRLSGPMFTVVVAGHTVATHHLAPRGGHRTVRLPEHTAALENVVLGQFSAQRPHARKVNRPPSDAALALAADLLGDRGAEPVIDLDIYRQITEGGDPR